MDRRKQGLGAVYRRRDGRWEGQIRIQGGPRRSLYARTRKDATHKLAEARWTLGQGLPVGSGAQPLSVYFATIPRPPVANPDQSGVVGIQMPVPRKPLFPGFGQLLRPGSPPWITFRSPRSRWASSD